MSTRPSLVFKFAIEDWEFEQIHRLNYRTFAEEIPQHEKSGAQRLVDKFHAQNTYLIGLCDQKLVGMLAVRGDRPFSLDQKLPELQPPGRRGVDHLSLVPQPTAPRLPQLQPPGRARLVAVRLVRQGLRAA